MGIPIIGDLISGVKDLVSEVIVDKDKKLELNYKLAELEAQAEQRYHEEMMAQVEVNKVEAAHSSLFVSGWRPFIGWVSGFGVSWTFVIGPMVEWISRLSGWTGKMPELDTGQLMALVTAMLGVAGYRTFEKVKGVQTTALSSPPPTPQAQKKEPEAPVEKSKKKKFKIF